MKLLIANRYLSTAQERVVQQLLSKVGISNYNFVSSKLPSFPQCKLLLVMGADSCSDVFKKYTPIESIRGYLVNTSQCPILPTFNIKETHSVTGGMNILIKDLIKTKHFLSDGKVDNNFTIVVNPSLADLKLIVDKMIADGKVLSFDIETDDYGIDVFGFCNSEEKAYTCHLLDDDFDKWMEIKRLMESPIPKLAQNGISFDLNKLLEFGIVVQNYAHDTLLEHHAMYSEMQKGLGFLASVYTKIPNWKQEYRASKEMTKELNK